MIKLGIRKVKRITVWLLGILQQCVHTAHETSCARSPISCCPSLANKQRQKHKSCGLSCQREEKRVTPFFSPSASLKTSHLAASMQRPRAPTWFNFQLCRDARARVLWGVRHHASHSKHNWRVVQHVWDMSWRPRPHTLQASLYPPSDFDPVGEEIERVGPHHNISIWKHNMRLRLQGV